jgi:hypothetical protein
MLLQRMLARLKMVDETAAPPDSFAIAEEAIGDLLKQLHGKRLCGCCVAQALAAYAVEWAEASRGREWAADRFTELALSLRDGDPFLAQVH